MPLYCCCQWVIAKRSKTAARSAGAQRGIPCFYAFSHCVSTLNKNGEAIFCSPTVSCFHFSNKQMPLQQKSYATSCVHAAQMVAFHLLPLSLVMTSNMNKRPTQCCFFECVLLSVPVPITTIITVKPYPSSRCDADPLFAILATMFSPCNRTPLHFQVACSV